MEPARTFESIYKELPQPQQAEVLDFANFLLKKHKNRGSLRLRQSWTGGLADLKDQFTSTALQKKSLEWRR